MVDLSIAMLVITRGYTSLRHFYFSSFMVGCVKLIFGQSTAHQMKILSVHRLVPVVLSH